MQINDPSLAGSLPLEFSRKLLIDGRRSRPVDRAASMACRADVRRWPAEGDLAAQPLYRTRSSWPGRQ